MWGRQRQALEREREGEWERWGGERAKLPKEAQRTPCASTQKALHSMLKTVETKHEKDKQRLKKKMAQQEGIITEQQRSLQVLAAAACCFAGVSLGFRFVLLRGSVF